MRKASLIFSTCLFAVLLVTVLSGCSLFDSIFGYSPEIVARGNVVQWAAAKNAVSYEIYADDKHYASTTDLYYIFDDLSKDSNITVTARNKRHKESSKSNSVFINKTSGFTADETMTIDLQSTPQYTVDKEIKCLIVSGTTSWGAIKIREDRSTDLLIELRDVHMTSRDRASCISTENNLVDADKLNFTVIFSIKGTNKLTGGTPSRPFWAPADNSQAKGETGGAGGCPIALPTIIMAGSGSLTLAGGKGGAGGTGAATTTWSTKIYGDGGDGGQGGDGLRCTTLYIASETQLTTTAGRGGDGGRPGENGSILTGPWTTSSWDRHYGKTGEEGVAFIGKQVMISGGERYAVNNQWKIWVFGITIGILAIVSAIGGFNYIRILIKKR